LKIFLLCFGPLSVALDALGVLPIFISFTDGLPLTQKHKVLQSVVPKIEFVVVSKVSKCHKLHLGYRYGYLGKTSRG
jgi:hypothetical protein